MQLLTDALSFPNPRLANSEGLLAIGGDLSIPRLLLAYSSGIFPWYNEGEPICWYSPQPRMVLFPDNLKVSKTMRQVLERKHFEIRVDTSFEAVMRACGSVSRPGQDGTWITDAMLNAYTALHAEGYAHSVEAWQEGELVGGLYGISIGKCFFGESMFAKVSNASKAAFISLVQDLKARGYWLIDCQVYTSHLASLGAELIQRRFFLEYMERNKTEATRIGKWEML